MKNTTVKTNRISLGVKIACILACVALFSVGFAAWLILQPTVEKEQLGSFEVYAAQENNIEITVTEGSENAKINFGAPISYTPDNDDWLVFKDYVASGDNATVEDLVATFIVNYSSEIKLADAVSELKIEFSVPDSAKALFGSNYLAAPIVEYNTTSATAADDAWTAALAYDTSTGKSTISITDPTVLDNADVTVYLRVRFGWGTLTSGQNPVTYFKGLEMDAPTSIVKTPASGDAEAVMYKNSEAAKLMFDAIDDLTGVNYQLTVNAE